MVQESLERLEWALAVIQEWFRVWASLVVMAVIQAMEVSLALQVTQVMAMEASLALVDSLEWATAASQWEWAAVAVAAAVAVVNPFYVKIAQKNGRQTVCLPFLLVVEKWTSSDKRRQNLSYSKKRKQTNEVYFIIQSSSAR
jgi:flagellar motor switch protein FliM